VEEDKLEAVGERLAAGEGMVRIAKTLGLGTGTVQRVKRETDALQAH
jgi:transposase-like protein